MVATVGAIECEETASVSSRGDASAGMDASVNGSFGENGNGELRGSVHSSGAATAEARRTHSIGSERVEITRTSNGDVSFHADANRRLGDNVEVRESASVNTNGEWSARHRADYRAGNINGGLSVDHGHRGFASAEVTGGLHTESGDHRTRMGVTGGLSDPKVDVAYGYRTHGGSAVNANGGIGENGRFAGAEGRVNFNDATSGSADLRWSETSGVDAGARYHYRPGDHSNFSVGVNGNSLSGRLGFDVTGSHGFTNDWGNGDVSLGVTANKDEVGANAGGNLSIPNLFGDDASFDVGATAL